MSASVPLAFRIRDSLAFAGTRQADDSVGDALRLRLNNVGNSSIHAHVTRCLSSTLDDAMRQNTTNRTQMHTGVVEFKRLAVAGARPAKGPGSVRHFVTGIVPVIAITNLKMA